MNDITDEILEEMGFVLEEDPNDYGEMAPVQYNCLVDPDRLKAGVAGAKQIILVNEKQMTGEWNTLEAEYVMREAIKNLKIFLGTEDKQEGEWQLNQKG